MSTNLEVGVKWGSIVVVDAGPHRTSVVGTSRIEELPEFIPSVVVDRSKVATVLKLIFTKQVMKCFRSEQVKTISKLM